jgi:hypothetical protein
MRWGSAWRGGQRYPHPANPRHATPLQELAKPGSSNDMTAMTDQTDPSPPKKPEPEATGRPKEIGGPKGPEPTRYGDWEVKGRCTDF